MAEFSEIEGRLVELGVMKKGDSFYSMLKLSANADSAEVATAMKPLIDKHNPRGPKNKSRKKEANDITIQLIAAREILRRSDTKALYDVYRAAIEKASVKKPVQTKTPSAKATPIATADTGMGQRQSTSNAETMAELRAQLERTKAELAREQAKNIGVVGTSQSPTLAPAHVIVNGAPIDYNSATLPQCLTTLQKYGIDLQGKWHVVMKSRGKQVKDKPVENATALINYTGATLDECIEALEKWGLDANGEHHHAGRVEPRKKGKAHQSREQGKFTGDVKCIFSDTAEVIKSVSGKLQKERQKWTKTGDQKLVAAVIELEWPICTGLPKATFALHQSKTQTEGGAKTRREKEKLRQALDVVDALNVLAAQTEKKGRKKKASASTPEQVDEVVELGQGDGPAPGGSQQPLASPLRKKQKSSKGPTARKK